MLNDFFDKVWYNLWKLYKMGLGSYVVKLINF